jgi:hypothetical protein
MKKLTATLVTLVLLTQIAPIAAAKQKGDWDAVKALVNHSIAFKTKNRDTSFGLLQFVDDAGIKVQIAGKEDFASHEISVRRDEIEKLWRAKLRFGERSVGNGALIGIGAGLGAALVTAVALHAKHSDDPPVGLGLFPLYGAGAGMIVAAFWKKKHKKQELIYSV